MKETVEQLQQSALESCKKHGHDMTKFVKLDEGFMAVCRTCQSLAFVDLNPQPNGINIHGRAVAIHCKGAE